MGSNNCQFFYIFFFFCVIQIVQIYEPGVKEVVQPIKILSGLAFMEKKKKNLLSHSDFSVRRGLNGRRPALPGRVHVAPCQKHPVEVGQGMCIRV